jgi:hypothetical protein
MADFLIFTIFFIVTVKITAMIFVDFDAAYSKLKAKNPVISSLRQLLLKAESIVVGYVSDRVFERKLSLYFSFCTNSSRILNSVVHNLFVFRMD